MSSVILDLHYLPSISYFSIISKNKLVILDDTENYSRQTYRNRGVILSANGPLKLTVPLNHKSPKAIKKTEISYVDNWYSNHKKSIESAYRRSPYYDFYADEILECLSKKHQRLWNLNHDILSTLIEQMGLSAETALLSSLDQKEIKQADDFRNKIKPKKPVYLHKTEEYQQVFGDLFTPNLSILDLLFCTGPETLTYL